MASVCRRAVTGCTRSPLVKSAVKQCSAALGVSVARCYSSAVGGLPDGLVFRQLFDHVTYTYTYILGDTVSKEAIIIDPVLELVDRDLSIAKDIGLNLKYAVNTHVHADHITGSGVIGQRLDDCKSVLAIAANNAKADKFVEDKEAIKFGSSEVVCRSTPGHTDGCITIVWNDGKMVFTGDAVLIRGCGRTDFQQGNAEALYNGIHSKIFTLPDDYQMYPGHDYTGQTVSTVGEEKRLNPRLNLDLDGFKDFMKELKLPLPNKLAEALPANMLDGLISKEAPAPRV